MEPKDDSNRRIWEVRAAFTFGVSFVLLMVATAFLKPEPTAYQYTVFRIVISLAAAGVGAILPGFLDVSFKKWLRAGGALALFVLVYTVKPVLLDPVDGGGSATLRPPSSDAIVVANEWLNVFDSGQYQQAYTRMGKIFSENYSSAQFEQLSTISRKPLGSLISRQVQDVAPFFSPPGAPKGVYQNVLFRSRFSNETNDIFEQVTLMGEQSIWRVVGYHLATRNTAGQFVPYEPR